MELVIVLMAYMSASIAEHIPNATDWNFKEDISPKWVKDAEDHVARAIKHMMFQKDRSLWPQLGSSNPYSGPEWDENADSRRRLLTTVMLSDDDVCKATNFSIKLGYRLARNEKDCTFKNKARHGSPCGEVENFKPKWCSKPLLDPECMEDKVEFDELQFCCGSKNELWDHFPWSHLREYTQSRTKLKDCCIFPGSYCHTKNYAFPCCGKKHGLVHNFKCMMDHYDFHSNLRKHRDPIGHCWFPGIAGLKGKKPKKTKKTKKKH
jgi:hypothetical protein